MERPFLTRIAVIAASEMTVKAFLRQHIAALSQRYSVVVVVNTSDPALLEKSGIDATLVRMPIARNISPLLDLVALFRLFRLFRTGGFDVVHSVTPKAGLLATLAASLAGVPLRLHTFTGQVWVTRRGPMRALLKAADRLITRLATHVLVDSVSQRAFLVSQGIASESKATVLGHGSISGVDIARFRPNPPARKVLRESLGIRDSETVFLYMGRLKRDKGMLDLARAFAASAANRPGMRLMLVGPDEDGLEASIRGLAGNSVGRLLFAGYTDRPEDYYACADVFCLPSYREGFGSSILEAAAAGLPSIGSRIYGITDAIEEGSTGLLFEAGNVDELTRKIAILADERTLRERMGRGARQRAARDFSADALTAALLYFYERLLAARSGKGG